MGDVDRRLPIGRRILVRRDQALGGKERDNGLDIVPLFRTGDELIELDAATGVLAALTRLDEAEEHTASDGLSVRRQGVVGGVRACRQRAVDTTTCAIRDKG